MIFNSMVFTFFGDPITVCLTAVTLVLVYYICNYDRSYPEGPFQYPIIGNIPQIAAAGSMISFLEKYRKTYGDVFTMRSGGLNRVVISGYDNIHELLIKKADYTSNRSTAILPKIKQKTLNEAPGLIWAPHPSWKTMRSFALNQLREEGMGKSWMEIKIMEEANKFVEHFLEPSCGSPIVMDLMMSFMTTNIISQMVLGKRFDYSDPQLAKQNNLIAENSRLNSKTTRFNNLWFLRFLPGDLISSKEMEKVSEQMIVMRDRWIEEAHKNPDRDCYVTQALKYAEQQRKEGQPELAYSDKSISATTLQLYIAGTDTTSTLLNWALLYMVLNPDIQERVRAEIKEQIGERQPSMKDKLSMPYTDAVFHESLRISSIATITLPHLLEKEVILNGKTIPANSHLMINLRSVLHDREVYPEPEKFNPERFMGEEGRILKSKVIGFGIGRRACLGEPLARMEFFLFFTTFLQKFKLTYPKNEKPTATPNIALLNRPQKYKIIFHKA